MACKALLGATLKDTAARANPAYSCELATTFTGLAGECSLATATARFAVQCLVATAIAAEACAVMVDRADPVLEGDTCPGLVPASTITEEDV